MSGLVDTLVTATQASAASGVASSTTSFSPSAGSMVVVVATYLMYSNTTGITFTCADSNGVSYSQGVFEPNQYGADYSMIYTHQYASAPGAITVKITASNTSVAADCLIEPHVITGQSTSQTGAASASASSGSASSTDEVTIVTTKTGSLVFIASSGFGTTPTAISGTTQNNYWNDTNAGDEGVTGRTTSPTGTPGSTLVGWTLSAGNSFGYAICALEVIPAAAGGALDTPQIKPGPTWLSLFKPGWSRPKTQTVADRVSVDQGGLAVTLPTLVTSLSGTVQHVGSLSVALAAPATSITAIQINPNDVPQINPGPTWLDYFKPGLAKPRPITVTSSDVPVQGTIAASLPTLLTSISAVITNTTDVSQINPGPTWLALFKPWIQKPRPVQPFPSPPVEFGSLGVPLPTVAVFLSGEVQHNGTLTIVLPVLPTSINATTINPRSIPQINPGPVWLDHFKPGLLKPRPALPVDSGVGGILSIVLPMPTISGLNGSLQNHRDVPQINPGPTWLGHFKPGLPKPHPLPITSTFAIETGSLVIIMPPGVRVQLEAGPLNIVLPSPRLALTGKYQYGHLNIVLKAPTPSLTGTAQQTHQGVLVILMSVPKLGLQGINGRETVVLATAFPNPKVFLLAKIVHDGNLAINMGGGAHLTRFEMFGCESRVELVATCPTPEMSLTGEIGHLPGIPNWIRSKKVRKERRHLLRGARAAVEARRHNGEEEP